jgi:hypothetical protein
MTGKLDPVQTTPPTESRKEEVAKALKPGLHTPRPLTKKGQKEYEERVLGEIYEGIFGGGFGRPPSKKKLENVLAAIPAITAAEEQLENIIKERLREDDRLRLDDVRRAIGRFRKENGREPFGGDELLQWWSRKKLPR